MHICSLDSMPLQKEVSNFHALKALALSCRLASLLGYLHHYAVDRCFGRVQRSRYQDLVWLKSPAAKGFSIKLVKFTKLTIKD